VKRFSLRRSLAWLALVASFACSTGTPYSQLAMPDPAPGQGRILIYMEGSQGDWWPYLSVDGTTLGKIKAGTFFYVDRAIGEHQVGVPADPHLAGFGNQGATEPVTVLVQAGQIAYVQVTVVVTPGMIMAVLEPEAAADAQRDLEHLDLVPPAPQ
jgi:hypothetical protein